MVETMISLQWWCGFIPRWPCVFRLKLLCFLLNPSSMFSHAAIAYILVVGGCDGEDDKGRRLHRNGEAGWLWWPYFFVWICSASHYLCCVFSLLHSFLPAVGGAATVGMRADDCCGGDKECWWWLPSIYPVVAFSIRWVCSPAFLYPLVALCFLFF